LTRCLPRKRRVCPRRKWLPSRIFPGSRNQRFGNAYPRVAAFASPERSGEAKPERQAAGGLRAASRERRRSEALGGLVSHFPRRAGCRIFFRRCLKKSGSESALSHWDNCRSVSVAVVALRPPAGTPRRRGPESDEDDFLHFPPSVLC